jgi:hypothetical protein
MRPLRRWKLGEMIIYLGRALAVRGLDPMSVGDPLAQLKDRETAETLVAPLAELAPSVPVSSQDP